MHCSPVARELLTEAGSFPTPWPCCEPGHSLEIDLPSMLINSSWSHRWPPHRHVIGILMDQGCGAVQMLQPEDWALSTAKRFWH